MKLDPKILEDIRKRLEKGEHLWQVIDSYELTMNERLEILRLFDDQRWD
jgi:hypothetical protein